VLEQYIFVIMAVVVNVVVVTTTVTVVVHVVVVTGILHKEPDTKMAAASVAVLLSLLESLFSTVLGL